MSTVGRMYSIIYDINRHYAILAYKTTSVHKPGYRAAAPPPPQPQTNEVTASKRTAKNAQCRPAAAIELTRASWAEPWMARQLRLMSSRQCYLYIVFKVLPENNVIINLDDGVHCYTKQN